MTDSSPESTRTSSASPLALLAAALEYASHGWAVFPCWPSKTPRTPRGFKDATTDPARITGWWSRWPDALIGAQVPDSLAVIDLDARAGGFATMAALEIEHGELPATLTCLTGGPGVHHYFLHPGGELRQGAGVLGAGIDTRMPGKGYTILPPSPHPTGAPYEWWKPDTPPAPMPRWIVRALRPAPPPAPRPAPVSGGDRYAAAALKGEVEKVRTAPEGTRNHSLNAAAYAVGTLVGAGLIDRGIVEAHLAAAGQAAGLGTTEVAATVRSGLEAGIANPRRVAS